MAGYDYSTYITDVGSALEVPVVDATLAAPFINDDYNNWLPRAIEYAEQRIYRELDLLFTHISDASTNLTANQRRFVLPSSQGTFIVVEEVNVTGPSGAAQLLPVSKQYLDAAWPSNSSITAPSVPTVWCPFDQTSIFVGPPSDTAYPIEIVGTIRPAPLSSTNTTTVLTNYLPDLFMAGTMISWTGFIRDYGQSSDDPALAMSWEKVYETALASAGIEEVRKKMMSAGWNARLPSPIATPPQT